MHRLEGKREVGVAVVEFTVWLELSAGDGRESPGQVKVGVDLTPG